MRHQKTMNLATETPEQREARINCHLKNIKMIVLTSLKVRMSIRDAWIGRAPDSENCLYAGRPVTARVFLDREEKVLTSEIKECFKSLTYKDIAVICERMAHQGTIQEATTPFYYVLQTVWKYRHPEAAEAQADRIKEEKSANRFNNFESHTYDFDFGKFMEINAMREIIRQPPLSKEEYMDSLKLIDK